MDDTSRQSLGRLVRGRKVAALGTLHDGGPFVSMAPYAVSPDGTRFYLHVSRLARHTRDMLADPRVCLLVMEGEEREKAPQALARVTIEGNAEELPPDAAGYDAARAYYLARLPQSRALFDLDDFSVFAIAPVSARFVGGFARAFTLTPEDLAAAIAAAS
jgi:putative heme iron utilization protein